MTGGGKLKVINLYLVRIVKNRQLYRATVSIVRQPYPMVNTSIVVPKPLLQRYVSSIELRNIDTEFSEILKPLHAHHATNMSLFIQSDFPRFISYNNQAPAFSASDYGYPLAGLMGIQTFMRGSFVFKGRYKIININFQPSGFHELFGIDAALLTDKLYNAYHVIGDKIRDLHRILQDVTDDRMIFALTEDWILQMYQRAVKYKFKQWPDLPLLIGAAASNETIEHLALMANMSMKSFERNFNNFVGVRPKLFAQIYRFNQVLKFKRAHPDATWSFISDRFNFYDQMHLIKEFKHFAGQTPARFFSDTPPPAETFLDP
jgi:AraC-like DNA-binding protein